MINSEATNMMDGRGKYISGNYIASETAEYPVNHTEEERDTESEGVYVSREASYGVQYKIYPSISIYGMYQKLSIYCRNRTNLQQRVHMFYLIFLFMCLIEIRSKYYKINIRYKSVFNFFSMKFI